MTISTACTNLCDIPRRSTNFQGFRVCDVERIELELMRIPQQPKPVLKLFHVSIEMLNHLKEKVSMMEISRGA